MRIGEAAAAAGMTAKTLRFYEESGLLPAAKRSGNGYRDYNQESVTRLDFIRRGRTAGLTLAQIGQILAVREAGDAPCAHVQDLLAGQLAAIDNQIAELVALRSVVAGLHAVAAAGRNETCDPGRICSYL
ncbi:heavy metal-responsive transcriptional regulator [Paenarthrobacter sp. CC6]|uniref:heavy metal-responsive transcriptional regulator n=1 Tax=Paenarthrobacter sp. CC6 TaxID=3029184 RepID=UPI00339D25A9